MLPYVVLIGAAVLGAVSIVMIVWSLRSRGRDRAIGRRGESPGIAPAAQPSSSRWEPAPAPAPVTSGLTQVADVSNYYDPAAPEPPTEFLSPEELPRQEADEDEIPTQFMAPDELFGDEREVKTEFMSEDELFGDEHEVKTAFMSEDELFREEGGPRGGLAEGPSHEHTIVLEAEAEPEPKAEPPASMPPRPPAARRPAPPKPPPSPRPASSGPQQFSMFVREGAHEQPSRDPGPPPGAPDFDDEDDPETALVHQSELMHVIAKHKADK